MKITLIAVGKTNEKYLKQGINLYIERIQRYIKFEFVELPEVKAPKKQSIEIVKNKEAQLLEKHLKCENVVLLDENGTTMSSEQFAKWLERQLNSGQKCLSFVIGGPYGFSSELKRKYPAISLSPMTFSHQLVRLVFLEQLYRAFTIINQQPYHH